MKMVYFLLRPCVHSKLAGRGLGAREESLICVILPQDWAEGGSGSVLPNDKRREM